MGYRGITHGGILAALLDETMGWAPAVQQRRFCVSVKLTVEYIKPVPIGTEITVTGRVKSGRNRLWETEGAITGLDGKMYARAHGRYMTVTDEQTREVISYLTFDEGCLPADAIRGRG